MMVENSERLRFQLMDETDANLLFQLDQDEEVMRYINGGKMTTMQQIDEVYMPRLLSYTNTKNGWGMWKTVIRETDEFIGWVLVRPMDFFSDNAQLDNLELGWRFNRSSWGKGYGTEAALSVKKALLRAGGIKKLSAVAFEENKGSVNIMQKIGMKYIKTDIHKDPLGDAEVVYYEIEL